MHFEQRYGGERDLRDAPMGELFRGLVHEGQALLREEVRLAKAEVREEARKAARGGAMVGAGGAVVYVALFLLAATLVLVGATFLQAWLSALIVTALFAAAGLAVLKAGQKQLGRADPVGPVKREIQEEGRWASETMRDVRSTRRAEG